MKSKTQKITVRVMSVPPQLELNVYVSFAPFGLRKVAL